MKDHENFDFVDFNNRIIEVRKYFEEIGFSFPSSPSDAFRQYHNRKSHYINWWWADLLEFGRQWGRGSLDIDGAANLFALYRQIKKVSHVDGFSSIRKRLFNKREFLGAAFEITVLSFLLEAFIEVKTVPTGATPTPDFQIFKDEEIVFVEVKSIKYDVSECEHYAHIMSEIFYKLASKNRVSCCFRVTPKVALSDINIEDFRYDVRNMFKLFSDENNILNSECDNYIFNLIRLRDFDQSTPISDLKNDIERLGTDKFRYDHYLVDYSNIFYRNLISISIDNFNPTFLVSKLKNLLQDAGKQLSDTSPGVVFINLPYGGLWQFDEIESVSLIEIFKYLQGCSKRINAVVLVGIAYKPVIDQALSLNYERSVIPNFNAISELPAWFSLFERHSILQNVQVGMEIQLEGVSCRNRSQFILIDYCSKDGKEQLKVYLDNKGYWKIKVTCKEIGAVIVKFLSANVDMSHEFNVFIKIDRNPTMAINGFWLEVLQ